MIGYKECGVTGETEHYVAQTYRLPASRMLIRLERKVLKPNQRWAGYRPHHQRALQYHNSSRLTPKNVEATEMLDRWASGSNRRGMKRIHNTKEGIFGCLTFDGARGLNEPPEHLSKCRDLWGQIHKPQLVTLARLNRNLPLRLCWCCFRTHGDLLLISWCIQRQTVAS